MRLNRKSIDEEGKSSKQGYNGRRGSQKPQTGMFRLPLLFTCLGALVGLTGCAAPRPDHLGLTNGRFAPCPDSPNCVSSFADREDSVHYTEPFSYEGDGMAAKERLMAAIDSMERTEIIELTDDYVHAEFTSKVWKFVDDAEFFFPENEQVIHVKSASRIGYADMGVNRDRIEKIRALMTQE